MVGTETRLRRRYGRGIINNIINNDKYNFMSIENPKKSSGRVESAFLARKMAEKEKPYRESKMPFLKGVKKGEAEAETLRTEYETKIKELYAGFENIKATMQEKELKELQLTPISELESKSMNILHGDKARVEDYPDYDDLPKEEQEMIDNEKSYGYDRLLIDENSMNIEKISRNKMNVLLPNMGKPFYRTNKETIAVDVENGNMQDFLIVGIDSGWTTKILDEFNEELKQG
jgi:rubrerythrin